LFTLLSLLALITGAVFASIKISERGIVLVQTGKVTRMDLISQVTAWGGVKPRNYINIGANTTGAAPITAIYVKEGDHVKKGRDFGPSGQRAARR
jgi:HlyD family secretion protein